MGPLYQDDAQLGRCSQCVALYCSVVLKPRNFNFSSMEWMLFQRRVLLQVGIVGVHHGNEPKHSGTKVDCPVKL
jgi:hypothetical protein